MKLYVGNLAYEVTEDELRSAFAEFGEVESVKLITDNYSGRSKGFGFVELNDDNATQAIGALDGIELKGRAIKVSESRPQEPRESRESRPRRSSGGFGGRGGNSGGRRGGGSGRGGFGGGKSGGNHY
ncbi:MAG: RNA-binding protein [Deltaproteobacteria bacterium]|jgi:RNA recognition motif-containing protein|nr:RNA-binding protein [Deltaproteobacteria bacterium]